MSTPAPSRSGRIRFLTPQTMLVPNSSEDTGSLSVSRRGSQTSANSKASMGLDDIFVQMACPKFLDELENADGSPRGKKKRHAKTRHLQVREIREWNMDDDNECSGAHDSTDIEAMYDALGPVRNLSVACLEDNPVTPAEVQTKGWKLRPEVKDESIASTPTAPNTARRRKKNNAARGRRRIDWKSRKPPAAHGTTASDATNVSLDAIKNIIQHSVEHTLQHTARAHYRRTLTPPPATYSRSACSIGSGPSVSSSCFTPRSFNTESMVRSKRAYRNDDSFATTAEPTHHTTSTNSSALLDTDSLSAYRHRCATSHGTHRYCDHDRSESAISCQAVRTHHHHDTPPGKYNTPRDRGRSARCDGGESVVSSRSRTEHRYGHKNRDRSARCHHVDRDSVVSSRTDHRYDTHPAAHYGHKDRNRCHHGDRDGGDSAVSSRTHRARCHWGTEFIKQWDTDSSTRLDDYKHRAHLHDTDGADSVASSQYVGAQLVNTPIGSRRSTMESVDNHAILCHPQNQPTDRSRDTEQHPTPRRTSLSSACTTIPRTSERHTLLEPRVPRLRLDQLQSLFPSPPSAGVGDLSPMQSCCSEQLRPAQSCVLQPTPRVQNESSFALQATPRVTKECIIPSTVRVPDSAKSVQQSTLLELPTCGVKETLTSNIRSAHEVTEDGEGKADKMKGKENIPPMLSPTRMPQRFMSEPSCNTLGDNPRRFRQSVFGFRQRARRMGARLSRMFVHKEGMEGMRGTMEISDESWRNLCSSSFTLHDIAE